MEPELPLAFDDEIVQLASDPSVTDGDLAAFGKLEAVNAYRAAQAGEPGAEPAPAALPTEPTADVTPPQDPAPAGATGDGGAAPTAEAGDKLRDDKGRFKPVIPKERLDEEAAKRRAADEQLSRALQVIETLANQRQQPAAPAAVQPAPQPAADPVALAEARMADLDRRYDEGEIDPAEYRKEQRALNRELARAEAEKIVAASSPFTGDLVEATTAAIVQQNPWIEDATVVPQPLFNRLLRMAQDEVEGSGVPLDGSPRANIAVQRAIVAIGREMGLHERATATASQPAPRPSGATGAAPAAPQARAGARPSLPPDIGNAGVAKAGADDPQSLLGISDSDIMAGRAPRELLERLMKAHPG